MIKKIVVILHRKTDENRVLVDVPWCNGSTRVFGSLSHRSNRCGTTSPSRALLAPSPFWQGSYSSQCLHDTAFFCPCSPYSLSNFRFSWLHYFSASSQARIENQWVTSNKWAVLGGVLMKSGIRGYSFFLCNCIAVQPTIPTVFFRIVFVRFSFGSRSSFVHPPFILRSGIEDWSKNERRIIGGKTEMYRNSNEKPRERRPEQKLYF